MPNWFFAALFVVAFPIYRTLHKDRAYGRVVNHLERASQYSKDFTPTTARDVFQGIYWNALDSYRGLARFESVIGRIVFENEPIMYNALKERLPNGMPAPIAAISIHQGPFELLHRSLCRYSGNVHLITDSIGDSSTRELLKELRSDSRLTEYHPDELQSLLRNLFDSRTDAAKGNAILAMVIDQGRNTKGTKVKLFGQDSTLYLRLPEMVNRMGAGIVTFRTFTRPSKKHAGEIVIRFEKYYPPKFNSLCQGTTLSQSIAHEVENWIAEHPAEWCWNYHGNFRI